MNLLADEWSIQHRSEVCAVTGRPFAEGENFYTLLFRDGDGFRRQDLSQEAWQKRNENLQPFSFWRATFEPPAPEPPEPLPKENAEELFRRLVQRASTAMPTPAMCSPRCWNESGFSNKSKRKRGIAVAS